MAMPRARAVAGRIVFLRTVKYHEIYHDIEKTNVFGLWILVLFRSPVESSHVFTVSYLHVCF